MVTDAGADIGIIVLAAGAGRRFGSDKRRARLPDGHTLLSATLAAIPAFAHKLLVLREDDQDLADQFGDEWQICMADDPQSGMANSLASGIRQAGDWNGALIALGDMPYVLPQTYTAIRAALASADIVVPVFEGKRGNPVAFRHDYFAEIAGLSGDKGARDLLEKHAGKCRFLDTGDGGILRDVDRPDMLSTEVAN